MAKTKANGNGNGHGGNGNGDGSHVKKRPGPLPGQRRRTDDERLRDMATISRLLFLGYTQEEMSRYLTNEKQLDDERPEAEWKRLRPYGVSPDMVYTDLVLIRAQWRATMLENFDALRGDALGALLLAAKEALTAWYKSQGMKVDRSTKFGQKFDGKGDPARDAAGVPLMVPLEASNRQREEFGDPRYMTEFRNAWADIRKLMGLDAITTVSLADLDAMIDADMNRLRDAERAVAALPATTKFLGRD